MPVFGGGGGFGEFEQAHFLKFFFNCNVFQKQYRADCVRPNPPFQNPEDGPELQPHHGIIDTISLESDEGI